MIRRSTEASPDGVLSAYKDNAAVIAGAGGAAVLRRSRATAATAASAEPIHMLMKVETHNHPTAISPFPGAATGSGGEIRDEGATGRGAKPKAGADRVLGLQPAAARRRAARGSRTTASRRASPRPSTSCSRGRWAGRRSTTSSAARRWPATSAPSRWRCRGPTAQPELRGYHKPIMIAGGLGNIRDEHVHKGEIPPGAAIVVLGGPALLIGLGGGAASSVASGASQEDLDFASVQRDNAEMQRRCQEVIDRCWALGADNPIVSIHDVGAGGLSNALPELVHDSRPGRPLRAARRPQRRARRCRRWSCGATRPRSATCWRIAAEALARFEALCRRERGAVRGAWARPPPTGALVVDDPHFGQPPHRSAAGGAARQAAAHAAGRAPG